MRLGPPPSGSCVTPLLAAEPAGVCHSHRPPPPSGRGVGDQHGEGPGGSSLRRPGGQPDGPPSSKPSGVRALPADSSAARSWGQGCVLGDTLALSTVLVLVPGVRGATGRPRPRRPSHPSRPGRGPPQDPRPPASRPGPASGTAAAVSGLGPGCRRTRRPEPLGLGPRRWEPGARGCVRGGPSPSVEVRLLIPAPRPAWLPGVCWWERTAPRGGGAPKTVQEKSWLHRGWKAGCRRWIHSCSRCGNLSPTLSLWEKYQTLWLHHPEAIVNGGESVVAGDGLGFNAVVTVELGGPRPTCSSWGGFLQNPEKRIF